MDVLHSFDIKILVDIRSLPGSRKFPQFNKEELMVSLAEVGIQYFHFADLGGRRKVQKDSKNTRWNNPSFQGYADYMETNEFEQGVTKLKHLAIKERTDYMCSEASMVERPPFDGFGLFNSQTLESSTYYGSRKTSRTSLYCTC